MNRSSQQDIEDAASFLRMIGFTVEEAVRRPGTFLPGVWPMDGGVGIRYTNTGELWAADMYHEAGHLAVLPSELRAKVREGSSYDETWWNAEVTRFMERESVTFFTESLDPNTDPAPARCYLQSGDAEAVAWEWAAMCASGAQPGRLLTEDPEAFGGDSVAVALALLAREHQGINGLCAAKMTTKQDFPILRRWMQP